MNLSLEKLKFESGSLPIKNDKLTVKQQVLAFTAIAIALIIMFIQFVFLPQQNTIQSLHGQLRNEQQQVAVLENYQIKHPDIEAYRQELDLKLQNLNNAMPENPDISSVLRQLDQTALSCGVQLLQVKPKDIVNEKNYREIPLDITIRGTYKNIMDLLLKLEQMPRLTNVTSIDVAANDDILEARLAATVYCYGAPPGKSVKGQPGAPQQGNGQKK